MVSKAANKHDAVASTMRPSEEDDRKCAARRPAAAAITCGPEHLGKLDRHYRATKATENA